MIWFFKNLVIDIHVFTIVAFNFVMREKESNPWSRCRF